MAVNFFREDCSSPCKDKRFGICDDVDSDADNPPPAYIKSYGEVDWIATVKNDQAKEVIFTAIDHCVVKGEYFEGGRPQACDGMIHYNDTVIFIELKEATYRKWEEGAMNQLYSTLQLFRATHTDAKQRVRKAYIANKAYPQFERFRAIDKNRFEDTTGFDLHTTNEILIS